MMIGLFHPIRGVWTSDLIRQAIWTDKPDAVWIMTDPRFWGWLWEMEEEIRSHCSLILFTMFGIIIPIQSLIESFIDQMTHCGD